MDPSPEATMAGKLSRDLCNIAVQLRSGLTRGSKPRELTDDEINVLKRRRDSIRDQMVEARKQRISARVNQHTTAESDRVIAASADHSKSVVTELTRIVNEAKSEILSASRKTAVKGPNQKLVGKLVVAAEPDQEMGDVAFEVCHAEEQTFPDGQKRTVCLIKAEGKPTLSREFSKLSAVPDPFAAGSVDQPVRVLVVSTTGESAGMRFHMGWRGTVTKVHPSRQVRVNFPYLGNGKVLSRQATVPRELLQILTDDDVSMLPNIHPWLGRRVTTLQTGQAGEIVDVNSKGRVKIALETPEKKKTATFLESRGSSFETLFTLEPRADEEAPVLPDQPQAAEAQSQATPSQPLAAEAPPHVEHRGAASVADSDAESDHPASARHDSDEEDEEEEEEEEEPLVPKRTGNSPAKVAVAKNQAAGSAQDAKPAPKRKGTNPAKAAVVKSQAAGSAEETKPAPKRRTGKQPARAAVVKSSAAGSDEEPKPAPKRKGKELAKAAPKRRRKSSVDVD